MKRGSLVYVPAEVELYQLERGGVVEFVRLEKPANLLLLKEKLLNEKYLEVWYNERRWYVKNTDVKF